MKIQLQVFPKTSLKKQNSYTIQEVRFFMLKENNPSDKTAAKLFKFSVRTVNKMTNTELHLKKSPKHNAFHRSLRGISLTTYL